MCRSVLSSRRPRLWSTSSLFGRRRRTLQPPRGAAWEPTYSVGIGRASAETQAWPGRVGLGFWRGVEAVRPWRGGFSGPHDIFTISTTGARQPVRRRRRRRRVEDRSSENEEHNFQRSYDPEAVQRRFAPYDDGDPSYSARVRDGGAVTVHADAKTSTFE